MSKIIQSKFICIFKLVKIIWESHFVLLHDEDKNIVHNNSTLICTHFKITLENMGKTIEYLWLPKLLMFTNFFEGVSSHIERHHC